MMQKHAFYVSRSLLDLAIGRIHVCNGVTTFVSTPSRQSRLSKGAEASCATKPQFISRLTKCFTHTCISLSKSFTQRHKCARANAQGRIVGKECTNQPIHRLHIASIISTMPLSMCATGLRDCHSRNLDVRISAPNITQIRRMLWHWYNNTRHVPQTKRLLSSMI